MPTIEASSLVFTLVILLSLCLFLLVFLVILALQIAGSLGRIERQASLYQADSPVSASAPSLAETSPGGAFEAFLSEDPTRRQMSKGEQFAAFRQWRSEKGMNWSNS